MRMFFLNFTRFTSAALFFCFTLTLHAQSNFDSERVTEVARVVSALEAYADQNGTYRVSNSGWDGNGQGWFHATGGRYPNSISSTLLDLGLLTSPLPKDPGDSDFLIYRCLDRIAVFSKPDSPDSIVPEAADLDWWQSNACIQFPISELNHTYFALSQPLLVDNFDSQRVTEVARVVSALETYGDQNGTYLVSNSGWDGNGQGWFHATGGRYPNSISSTLLDLGLLTSPLPKDPGDSDFLIYRCLDRIAVFSKPDSPDSIVPESADLDWWQSNSCIQFPISGLNHTYFALSDPLLANNFDSQRVTEVARVVSALEAYADQNGTYRVSDSGWDGNGEGWFHATGGRYPNSISSTLLDLGLLTSPLPKDPGNSDFLIYLCLDRVAVFSKPDSPDSIVPESADLDWWQSNSCIQFPISELNHTYFALSGPLTVWGCNESAN